jgi:hypothetical protein
MNASIHSYAAAFATGKEWVIDGGYPVQQSQSRKGKDGGHGVA